jgi:hypothetical protein
LYFGWRGVEEFAVGEEEMMRCVDTSQQEYGPMIAFFNLIHFMTP